ncbi:MAG: ferrochelatase [Verrucomicrobia bacterium]|nr:MAG: ferrochelatase [Verrucomicrobiota bacterium]
MSKKAILLVNLGSPDSTNTKDVRRYLKQFLMDPRVIDSPSLIRWLVVNLTILPFRPKKTAHAYSRIWTKEGSPLILCSKDLQNTLSQLTNTHIELAMTYGQPSIPAAIKNLKEKNIDKLFIIPLFPHYAMSSYETALVAIMQEIKNISPNLKTTTLQPFYNDLDYIDALVESAKPYLDQDFDHLLFSFHGLPERHLRKSDPSHSHCLVTQDCCNTCNPAHATCYKHQCLETVKLFAQRANLSKEKYSISFQSRLGRDPWLQPFTDHQIAQFPEKGIKKLLVICPAFVADCLETLEEIAMAGKEAFIQAGGEFYNQIPCLNMHPRWIQFLANKILSWT